MVETSELIQQIEVVAKEREAAKVLVDKKKAMYDAFISQHTKFFADVVVAATKVGEEEALLRDMTIEVYNQTGEKKPAPGVGIRELTNLDYDPKEALKWATEHKLALSLDKKAFEGYAKQEDFDFVTSTIEIQATIAAELKAGTDATLS